MGGASPPKRRSPSAQSVVEWGGVDLGLSRTAVAISKGLTIRPLTVGELAGEELEIWLLDLALKQDVDEFIIGLPKETEESNKARSVAGRLAVRAAERKRRVFLQDERGASCEGVDHIMNMIAELGSDGEQSIDAYAAMTGGSNTLENI